ncbi:MAG: DUF2231 domain-containing protein [Armatimonadetes bacterium]|nr:DUF2231 domain-containing protein [Armatimonadota bacterium]NIM23243.1 DUF2231 domain-containing protein [Armatimonadota bacterium]NIM67111.1 DUF2231 domain-containing protein [Armatimonadota bacterium]NIM75638.1 DUF2231 domain-containing protein [Armatimonadota bacterium]NIN05300.1 DUF2231 domain-containing protein [Armatimonadota bacterium]
MTTGLMAADSVPHPEAAHEIMETHEVLGITVAILSSMARLIKLDNIKFLRIIFVALFIITGGIMSYGAYLGGKLVFDYGVGTALVTSGMVESDEHHEHNEDQMHEIEEYEH